MTKKTLIVPLLCTLAMGACMNDVDYYQKPASNPTGEYYDFATTIVYDLNMEYRLRGYSTGILFEVYTENPFTTSKAGTDDAINVLRTDIKPAFKAYTDAKGHFQGKMMLPADVTSAYFVTSYPGVPDCVKIPIKGTTLNVDMGIDYSASTRAVVQGANHSYPSIYAFMDGKDDWNNLGIPTYLNPNGRMTVPTGLISDINSVLPPGVNLANSEHSYLLKQGCSHSIAVKEAAEVSMAFIIDGAQYLSVVGYYTYPTNQPPTKPGDIKRLIVAFPNASILNGGGGLTPGDNVKLKYYNESTSKFEDKFPAGTTIGFFMHTNSFSSLNGNVTDISTSKPVYYSDPALNYYGLGFPEDKKQQVVALYDYKEDGRKLVVIGFEDQRRPYGSDHDFNDVMFYVKSNPASAIIVPDDRDPDMDPTPEIPQPYTIEYEGILGFEDNWPSRGDYDLNDVGIKYHSTVYYNKDNRITKTVDVIHAVAKGATFTNGFGYQFNVSKEDVSTFNIAVSPSKTLYCPTLEDGQKLATVMLFDNIHDEVGGTWNMIQDQTSQYTYTVTTGFATPKLATEVGFPPYNPFIFVNRPQKNVTRSCEVHLPNYKPTDKAMGSAGQVLFGHNDDCSDASLGLWYVSKENFPFAIHIPGNSFRFPNEAQSIDDAYPKYADWARSHGNVNADWYK